MRTIIDLFERSCRMFADKPYLWEKVKGKYQATTYAETKREALKLAGGLCALGLRKGERVALLGEGCNKWMYAELGMLYAGGVNVPLSIKLTDNEILFRVTHAGARFLIVSANFLERVRSIGEQLSAIEKIIVFNFEAEEGRFLSFEGLCARGEKWLEEHPGELASRLNDIRPEDLVNISYTSGTTAEPKGIMLSHRNYVSNVLQADSLIQIPDYYRILLLLPWDHSFAHTVGLYSFMYNGASVASVDFGKSPMEYLRNIPLNLKEVQPHVLLSVPALAKNFKKNIDSAIKAKGRLVTWMYRVGLRLASCYNDRGDNRGHGGRFLLKPLVCFFDLLVFRKIREIFGGNLQFFVGGGALLDLELQRYYAALGIPMYQGYGLSEASPVISSNTPREHRFGSSGILVTPLELEIRDESDRALPDGERGEICIRGGNVMEGYWSNEAGTAEVIRGGWLHTGDLGYMQDRKWLYVLGRFKSLLIANDGEKYSPEEIEETIAGQSEYIDYCVLYNNQSPYTVGLIVPNKRALQEYIARYGGKLTGMDAYRLMAGKIQEELMQYRAKGKYAHLFPERWLPAVVGILPEGLTEQNGLVNSTMKVVRVKVYERFQENIMFMYSPDGKNIMNKRNLENLKRLMD